MSPVLYRAELPRVLEMYEADPAHAASEDEDVVAVQVDADLDQLDLFDNSSSEEIRRVNVLVEIPSKSFHVPPPRPETMIFDSGDGNMIG